MTAVLSPTRRGRDLVDAPQFARLAARLVAEHPEVAVLAERIVDQALAFVAASAAAPNRRLVPSPLVDAAWHLIILDTKRYADLCAKLGTFVHHVPDEPADAPDDGTGPSGAVARTLEAIEHAGYVVDHELWPLRARCTSCHEEGGCSSGGKDGNENSGTRKPPPVR